MINAAPAPEKSRTTVQIISLRHGGSAATISTAMTGGTVVGSFIVGRLVTRTGHYRIFPIVGAGGMTILCGIVAAAGLGRFWPLDTLLTALLGLSFGAQLPSVMVPVQNALDLPDTGIGLSVVMFFRLIGRAFGVALLMALLVGDLNAAALSVPGHDVLGPNPGISLLHHRATRSVKRRIEILMQWLRAAMRSSA
jgi:MFS family permease